MLRYSNIIIYGVSNELSKWVKLSEKNNEKDF